MALKISTSFYCFAVAGLKKSKFKKNKTVILAYDYNNNNGRNCIVSIIILYFLHLHLKLLSETIHFLFIVYFWQVARYKRIFKWKMDQDV